MKLDRLNLDHLRRRASAACRAPANRDLLELQRMIGSMCTSIADFAVKHGKSCRCPFCRYAEAGYNLDNLRGLDRALVTVDALIYTVTLPSGSAQLVH
jgi:hypothetical protein